MPLYVNKGSCEPIVAYSAAFVDQARGCGLFPDLLEG